MTDLDNLFASPFSKVADFAFDENVARVFPDMIKRSVPGYPTIIESIGLIANQYARPNSIIYDLGCSLGAATQSMRRHVSSEGCRIIAIDNAQAMVERCREYLVAQDAMIEEAIPAEVITGDIVDYPLQACSVVVLNFTLQFIKPGEPSTQNSLEELHYAFKRANGYSELEIAQKRSAIENVMLPDTLEQHQQRLQQAGFEHSHIWFQCLNFCSMIART